MIADGVGRKSKTVWLTASKRLFKDIHDEIKDINEGIQVLTMKDILKPDKRVKPACKRILLLSYAVFQREAEIARLEKWMGDDFSGCVSNDIQQFSFYVKRCHK